MFNLDGPVNGYGSFPHALACTGVQSSYLHDVLSGSACCVHSTVVEVNARCWGSMAGHLNMYGSGQERTGGRKSVFQANRLNFFFVGARISVPRPVDLTGVGAEAAGDDPALAIRAKTDGEAGIRRVRGRMLEQWSERATFARVERATIERGIGPGGFCPRQRWAGSGRTGWKAAGRRYRAVGTGKRSAAARGGMAVTDARAARASAAARSATLGTIQKRGDPRRYRGRPLLGGRERRRLVPGRSAREGGRSRRAADQAAAPKTMSGRLVQTAERSSPSAR